MVCLLVSDRRLINYTDHSPNKYLVIEKVTGINLFS